MSGAAWPGTIGRLSTSACLASIASCSMAAGRRVSSEATSTFLRSVFASRSASLPVMVVLPEPCRPAIRITVGGFSESRSGSGSSPPSISIRPS